MKGIFENKVAIITGGTSGMGEEVSRMLHAEGASVVISGRNKDKGETLLNNLGERASFYPGDISAASTNEYLVKHTLDKFGKIDYLVCSAGQLGVGKLHEIDTEVWDKTVKTNLSAVFYLLKYALPELQDNNGAVCVIGSVAAGHAFPSHPAYAASKAGLKGLIRQAALDYGPSVRINLISPAQVDTPLLRNSVKAFENPESIIEDTRQNLPLKKLGTTKDIASAVKFLLSDEAGWVTGTDFVIDGGFTV